MTTSPTRDSYDVVVVGAGIGGLSAASILARTGWENTAAQTGTKRLAHESPLPGLYLSGHWSLPGGSSLRVLTSGVHTAMIILRRLGITDRVPLFEEANLPAT